MWNDFDDEDNYNLADEWLTPEKVQA